MPSPAGEAVQMLPASVPRFWICTPPTSRAASLRPSNSGGSSARMTSVQVVSAPMRQRCRLLGDAAQAGQGGDVEDVRVAHVAPAGARRLGRIDVGAAGQHRHVPRGADGERFVERGGAMIGDHQLDLRRSPLPLGRGREAMTYSRHSRAPRRALMAQP